MHDVEYIEYSLLHTTENMIPRSRVNDCWCHWWSNQMGTLCMDCLLYTVKFAVDKTEIVATYMCIIF